MIAAWYQKINLSVFSQIYGDKMFPKDKEKCGGGILFYVHENIQSQFFHLNSNHDGNEVILLEFSVKGNWKWQILPW